jgi:hypothetical protein
MGTAAEALARRQLSRVYQAVPGAYLSPGDVVVMDNLRSYKGDAVRRLIRRRQTVLSAPLLARSQSDRKGLRQLKTLLRKTNPRPIEATWRGIGYLSIISPPRNAPITSQMPVVLQHKDYALDEPDRARLSNLPTPRFPRFIHQSLAQISSGVTGV